MEISREGCCYVVIPQKRGVNSPAGRAMLRIPVRVNLEAIDFIAQEFQKFSPWTSSSHDRIFSALATRRGVSYVCIVSNPVDRCEASSPLCTYRTSLSYEDISYILIYILTYLPSFTP